MHARTQKFWPPPGREPAREATRSCDHPKCSRAGEFRAPKSRQSLNDYFWFCLDHVRDYNRAWDYCAGMTPEEIERMVRADVTWQRASWPLGRLTAGGFFGIDPERIKDHFGLFAEDFWNRKPKPQKAKPSPEDDAKRVMDLKGPLTLDLAQGAVQGTLQAASSRCQWRRPSLRRTVQGDRPGLPDPARQPELLNNASHIPEGATAPNDRKLFLMAQATQPSLTAEHPLEMPDIQISVRQTFGVDSDMMVPAFSQASEHVPDRDDTYYFDHDTTMAILAGFAYNRRVIVQGYHGTGKSTHIEQVASRLNWPCIRVNLDSHISRIDLVGKDAIVIKDGMQVTEFREGILPWALQHPTALVFDEYDAGRPDVMFVIQRVLEVEGKLTLLDQSRVIRPHPGFRLFATANTIGLGDTTGLYHGTQQINQGQMDRWNIVAVLNYLQARRRMRHRGREGAELRRRQGPRDGRQHGARRRSHPPGLHQR